MTTDSAKPIPTVTAKQLERFEPFGALSSHYLDEACAALQVHRVPRSKLIFKRAKLLERAYFLLNGRLDLIDNAFEIEQVHAGSERAAVALNQDSPTSVSAIAKSECVYFTIEREYLERLVSWSQTGDESRADGDTDVSEFSVEEMSDAGSGDWMASLLQCPLFTRIPTTQLQELFSSFENCPVKKGEPIIREGERGEYFYVLASGSARITNKTGSVNVALAPGQYFGEEALIGNTLRNATVTMEANGVLKRLTAEAFNKLLISPVLQYMESSKLDALGKPYKLIDVKMPVEYRVRHIPGSINIPLSRLRQSIKDFGHSHIYAVAGDAGSRADIAVHILCQAGFDAVVVKDEELQETA